MLLHIPHVLSRDAVADCRRQLEAAAWVDGRLTAGSQSEQRKHNLQLAEDSDLARALRDTVLDALGRTPTFFSAALPRRIYPPLFNCYTGAHNAFGDHVDNAVRTHRATQTHLRTDLSFTLFFTDPDEYDGGELVIEDTFGCQRIKLPAGDLVLYPSSSVHRVEPVSAGARIACFSWLESMVRETERRRLLYDLDRQICRLRETHGDDDTAVGLTSCYHNLVRMWACP
ncbi:MAG TPA: Fe2+-dependent dioxygenase [Rhodocyclaceae bacterium]|nr:Fe2+-dependent dioxygenase [Rhodocyclaceae bacterium]HMV62143.1 Fe2+-dependent dioxygenase [Rhodocyclaceae bacterium]HMW52516.1 Fe2+-dependent dioxygenase [Rhodocyclaceae bacterium]HMY49061.1 Fe2+-dependent dioxygenase [Rhodocyclaceae bacterium]